jgi:hypothetical protein
VTVTGASSGVTATTTFALTVIAPGFTLSVPPLALSVYEATPATATITVNYQDGFTGSVNLSVSGLPSYVTASFSPTPTTGSSVLTLAWAGFPTGSNAFYLTITGTSGGLTASTFLFFDIDLPYFDFSAAPSSLTIVAGTSGTSTLSATPELGYTGKITLTPYDLPSGVTASFSPNPMASTSVLTLTASSAAALGTTSFSIQGVGSNIAGHVNIALTVAPSPCDLHRNGNITAADVQMIINEALGVTPVVYDLSGTGVVNVLDVQIEINAALGFGCTAK